MAPSEQARRELEVDARVGIGWVALCEGNLTASLAHFAEAASALEKQGRGRTQAAVPHLLGTARARLAGGDRAGAQAAVDQARALAGAAGEPEIVRVQVLIDLAAGDAERAKTAVRRLSELEEGGRTLREMASTPIERHNLTMIEQLMRDLDASITVAALTGGRDAEAVRIALTSLLRRKGLVLDVVAARRAIVRKQAATSPGLAERAKQLAEIEAELAALERLPPSAAERASHAKRVAELVDAADHKHVAMSLHLPPGAGAVDAVKRSAAVRVEAVQGALPEDGALLEIARYKPLLGAAKNERERWGAPRYAAFVLKRAGEATFVDLGEASSIDALVLELRRALSEKRGDVKKAARGLYDRVLEPLRPALRGAKRLWIAPDGALHTVPFEALVDKENRYLVELAGVTYLGTGRELARPRASIVAAGAPVIIANPTFAPAAPGSKAEATRSADFRKVRFPPLPGTAAEAEGIHRALPNAALITGEKATRDALLSVARPSILHVATHGFYLAADAEGSPEGAAGRGLELDPKAAPFRSRTAVDPLVRSGLALAGADGGGGVLSALELSSVDLTGTKLAVLSACETGLGDVKSGEGVFGLRRALVIAGAEAQVVSLWKVDDDATRAMMLEYYKKLLAGGGRSEALRATRLAMMRRPATSHPYYWASFLVSGDATALDGSEGTASAAAPRPLSAPPQAPHGARGCGCEVAGAPGSTNWTIAAAALGCALIGRRRDLFNDGKRKMAAVSRRQSKERCHGERHK
jgi:CHAT domain-containing protein